ncbi:MAG: argininosuccinate lyase [Gammaproteobacteria bacterium]|nr:argininosuccinate lyase [Gammaproteobacteria bacterium]MDH5729859.1 argininosuccinate lyase [Gammaproteobacteria bacterium]
MSNTNKPWGGRFTEATDAFVEAFTASVGFDQRMYAQDIRGSIAHATMLAKVGVLTAAETDSIIQGLQTIEQEIEAGQFQWQVSLEDVHMNIESRLTALIGDAGKKLHTGRSRNDQVATDMRLYLRDELDEIMAQLRRLQTAILDLAESHVDTIMPGFTHLQVAQPISFGHHMLAWCEMLQRDAERFIDGRKRVNILPLGAAALAGTTYPIDRHYTAKLLDFDGVAANSLDAVSDRDFIIEFCASASLCMTHLSRFSEELIIWLSQQFSFIEMGDRFCTGSSIMPQKKNPDVPELIRGKSARVQGNLIAMLTLMKAQPLAYNKDNQEDKEPLFDSIDTLKASLRVFADMVPSIQVNKTAMRDAALRGFSTATDLADYLVRKGVAFRDAHEVVGKSVRFAIEQDKDLAELDLVSLQQFSSAIEADVYDVLSLEGSVAARDHVGGTAPKQVRIAIKDFRQRIA